MATAPPVVVPTAMQPRSGRQVDGGDVEDAGRHRLQGPGGAAVGGGDGHRLAVGRLGGLADGRAVTFGRLQADPGQVAGRGRDDLVGPGRPPSWVAMTAAPLGAPAPPTVEPTAQHRRAVAQATSVRELTGGGGVSVDEGTEPRGPVPDGGCGARSGTRSGGRGGMAAGGGGHRRRPPGSAPARPDGAEDARGGRLAVAGLGSPARARARVRRQRTLTTSVRATLSWNPWRRRVPERRQRGDECVDVEDGPDEREPAEQRCPGRGSRIRSPRPLRVRWHRRRRRPGRRCPAPSGRRSGPARSR